VPPHQDNHFTQSTWFARFDDLALLFQPLFKVALGRTLWNLVDMVIAAGLFFLQRILSGEFAEIACK